jgi:hypothetical protein
MEDRKGPVVNTAAAVLTGPGEKTAAEDERAAAAVQRSGGIMSMAAVRVAMAAAGARSCRPEQPEPPKPLIRYMSSSGAADP